MFPRSPATLKSMSTSLIEAASSDYIDAQNVLRGGNKEVYIYVEGLDDIPFWNEFTLPYSSEYTFKISCLKTPDNKVLTGKMNLIEKIDINTLGKYKLIAVDSDFDWIIDNYKTSPTGKSYSRLIRDNNYVLHTYLYSIESYKCHSASIASIIAKCTCYTGTAIQSAYNAFSIQIAQLFLIHLASLHNCDGVYPIAKFRQDLNKIKIDAQTGLVKQGSVSYVNNRINNDLSVYAASQSNLITAYRLKLHNLGFTPNNYYLLCCGHDIRNSMVKHNIIGMICHIRRVRIDGMQKNPDAHQRENIIKNYENTTGIKRSNTAREIASRIDGLIDDCTDIHSAIEGYTRVKQDLDSLFK